MSKPVNIDAINPDWPKRTDDTKNHDKLAETKAKKETKKAISKKEK